MLFVVIIIARAREVTGENYVSPIFRAYIAPSRRRILTHAKARARALLDVNLTMIKISLPRARSPPVVCTTWIYSSAPSCFCSLARTSERMASLNFLTRHLHFYESHGLISIRPVRCFNVTSPFFFTCFAVLLPASLMRTHHRCYSDHSARDGKKQTNKTSRQIFPRETHQVVSHEVTSPRISRDWRNWILNRVYLRVVIARDCTKTIFHQMLQKKKN